MPLNSFTLRLNRIPKGRVAIGAADPSGNRSFTFTPLGSPAQPAQSINVPRQGNTRSVSSNAPFSLTIDGINYDRLSGSIDFANRVGSGSLHKTGTPGLEEDARDLVAWDATDVVTPFDSLEPEVFPITPHVRSFDMKLGSGVAVGHVEFGNPDGVGNRSFTFTNTGGGPQPTQSVTVTRVGNVRTLSSGSGFTLTLGTQTFTGISGSLNLLNRSAVGFLIADTPGNPRNQVEWTSDDVVTPVE